MKAIMIMFDSLRRDILSCYGGKAAMPNFERLASHTVQFQRNYVGSMPCMPARRELHTGRYNFLHRSWGPIEPFDDSMPQILREHGIYTYLSTDHYHYLRDGGATYQGRYSGWDCHRGQESDEWKANLKPVPSEFAPSQLNPEYITGSMREARRIGGWQNFYNREAIKKESDYPMHKTFDSGLEFLDKNGKYDNWFLQIETFDPHEPFIAPENYQAAYMSADAYSDPDWPLYARVHESKQEVESMRKKYLALLSFCDKQLGRVLDKMDELNLWKDTLLIVNTDHGFLLGEHEWWGKGSMPNYEELVHIPLFIWDPQTKKSGEKCEALVQTIDLAPTLLDFFKVEIPETMQGRSLLPVISGNSCGHDVVLFGYHNGPIGITDGRYVLLRAIADVSADAYEYTLMPTHMNSMFSEEELKTARLHPGFSFTKEIPVMKIKAKVNARIRDTQQTGKDLLFDLVIDPGQMQPLENEEIKAELLEKMTELLKESEAPDEIYLRYGLRRKC